jgi:hypothetical protein
MLDLRLSIEATQDAITGTQPTVSNDDLSQPPALVTEPQPPVLVTEQEVMFGTAAAVRPRSTPITRRMTGALRVAAAALRPPPRRPHYVHSARYLDDARMSRELDRL